jgi:hypothetical protein
LAEKAKKRIKIRVRYDSGSALFPICMNLFEVEPQASGEPTRILRHDATISEEVACGSRTRWHAFALIRNLLDIRLFEREYEALVEARGAPEGEAWFVFTVPPAHFEKFYARDRIGESIRSFSWFQADETPFLDW